MKESWPRPDFHPEVVPHFLFILCPPYSGSTALAQVLRTSRQACFIQKRAEGQWHLPGMCAPDRWDSDKAIDWEAVRATWLAEFQRRKVKKPHLSTVIEKSPPNMVRLDGLRRLFPDHSLLGWNRDPYASCSSRFHRHLTSDHLDPQNREQQLTALAKDWLVRSECIVDHVNTFDIPLLTYERFCSEPTSLLSRLSLPESVTDSLRFDTEVKVKDYQKQGIVNQNERQISQLTPIDRETINRVLAPKADLLRYFGYELA